MDPILKFLSSHYSCRNFTDQVVTKSQEMQIVQTAQLSPTSSNLHAYSIVGVRDKSKREQIAVLSADQQHIKDSSLFLVFCADINRLKFLCDQRDYPFMGEYTENLILSTVDTALVASRAMMTAQAIGLGACMVGSIRNNPDKISELLELPKYVYPVMGMSLGFPSKEPKTKPKLPTDGIYHREKYSTDNFESAISEYDETIDGIGYLQGREVKPEHYPEFNGNYSWSEHTARRMSNESIGSHRPHMKQFLLDKGFTVK